MALKFYNTLTRKKEEFKPIKKGQVGIYSCGPTIYDFPHIGNYRAYVSGDVLKRYLIYKGFKVKHIMNLTDVDDKTIRNSKKEGIPLKKFTEKYEKAFFEDIKKLNIMPADLYPKATDHIKEMLGMIKKLVDKGLAYKGDDGSVYYKVSAFKEYGKLANLQKGALKKGASCRVQADEYAKEDADDFALWKGWTEEDGEVFWDSEFGKGRPGWHIECSAMSTKYLGKHFDIHTGGIDLVFPHHQNEIAQSEGSLNEKFVNYWIHNEWLLVNGQKMSKSLGNFFTLRDVLSKGYSPIAVRYLLLSTHYRQQLNFTFEGVEAAANSIQRLQDLIVKINDAKGEGSDVSGKIKKAEADFEKAMDDDLSISDALAAVFSLVKDVNILADKGKLSNKEAKAVIAFLRKINGVIAVIDFTEEKIPDELMKLIAKREEFRSKKMFADADRIREELLKKGVQLDDTKEGVKWKKLK
ncbi:cysteine--tRNA ligase [Candidatus Woesearchaeota archaeon]|nr:cysteine--tRNA ligase [Candidatus Woesearchaeota archaeon]